MASVLDLMKQKMRERLMPVHPIQSEDISVRFPYMIGVTMVALADGELTTEKQSLLDGMALSMGLPEEQLSRILVTASNIGPDTIDTIVDVLDKKEQRYVFILDLYNAGWRDVQTGPAAQEMIGIFAKMLKLGSSEQEFLLAFAASVLTCDVKKAEVSVAEAGEKGLALPASVLQYFLPGLDYQKIELQKGERLYYQGAFVEAVRCFEKAVNNNNPRAMYFYGNIMQFGFGGVEKNEEAAYNSFRRGNSLGYPFCQYETALLTRVEDKEKAQQIFKLAFQGVLPMAENNDKEAQWLLGRMYEEGLGFSENKEMEFHWFRKSAEQGNFRAQESLGKCYYIGRGVTQDYAEAVKWFRKSDEQGHALGQNYLGARYVLGEGVDRDYAEAMKWFRKAADQGNASAQCNMGNCYRDGRGVKQDKAEAIKWYRKAADQGHTYAQESLRKLS